MNKSMWNNEAVKAYESGQGVVLVEKPYPHYEPVAYADNGVVNWIADKQFMHEAELYIAPPQQELVCVCGAVWEGQELVEAPPQRTWVGLTEDEIVLISADCAATHQHMDIHFAKAIEAKLKAKNT